MLALADAADDVAELAARPRGRDAPDVDAREERQREHAHERRARLRDEIVAVCALVAEDREAVRVDLDALGHVDVDRAEHAEHEDRDRVALERRLAQVEVDVAEHRQADDAPARANAAVALRRAEQREMTHRVGRRRDALAVAGTSGRSRASSSSSFRVTAR